MAEDSKFIFFDKVDLTTFDNVEDKIISLKKEDELIENFNDFDLFFEKYKKYNPDCDFNFDTNFCLLEPRDLDLEEVILSNRYLKSVVKISNAYHHYKQLNKYNIKDINELERIWFFNHSGPLTKEDLKEILKSGKFISNAYEEVKKLWKMWLLDTVKLEKLNNSSYKLISVYELGEELSFNYIGTIDSILKFISKYSAIDVEFIKNFLYEESNNIAYLMKYLYFQKRFPDSILFSFADVLILLKKLSLVEYDSDDKTFNWKYKYFKDVTTLIELVLDKKEELALKLNLLSHTGNEKYHYLDKLISSNRIIDWLEQLWFFNFIRQNDFTDFEIAEITRIIIDNYHFLKKNNYDFSTLTKQEVINIMKILDKKLSFSDARFVVENNYTDIDNISEKLQYIKKLEKKYSSTEVSKILKLDINYVSLLATNDFGTDVLKRILSWTVSNAELDFLINKSSYITKITNELSVLPDIAYLSEKEKILNLLNEITESNFSDVKRKVDKDIMWLSSSISLAKSLIDIFWEELFFSLYNFFYSRKTKKNKLNAKLTLSLLSNLTKFDKNKLEEFVFLLNEKNIIISDKFVVNSDSIFKTIFSNFNLFSTFVKTYSWNLSLLSLQDMIDDKKKTEILSDLVNNLFPSDVIEFLDSVKWTDRFDIILDIAKLLDFKNTDEELVLEVILYDKKHLILLRNFVNSFLKLDIDVQEKSDYILKTFDYSLPTFDKLKSFISFVDNWGFSWYDSSEIWMILDEYFYWNLNLDTILISDSDTDISETEETYKWIKWLWWMSWKEIVSILTKLWFEEKKIRWKSQWKWDHKLFFRNENEWKTYIMIPMHSSVKASTLRDQLKRAGILNEFTSFLWLQ